MAATTSGWIVGIVRWARVKAREMAPPGTRERRVNWLILADGRRGASLTTLPASRIVAGRSLAVPPLLGNRMARRSPPSDDSVDVTALLRAWAKGDAQVENQLFCAV